MSSRDDYSAKIAEIEKIAPEAIVNPSLPVENALQEAEDLYPWAKHDEQQLTQAGLSSQVIEDLPVRAGACREAQALWNSDRNVSNLTEKEWDDKAAKAYELRDKLLHAFRYAYRKEPSLLSKVQSIADGTGHPDMIQDLSDLSVLGGANKAPLQAINFDINLLQQAAILASECAELLGKVNGDRMSEDESKIIRDKAYTYLKESVDEIRNCGKYVFWKDEERLKGYSSAYMRKLNRKKRNKDEDTQ